MAVEKGPAKPQMIFPGNTLGLNTLQLYAFKDNNSYDILLSTNTLEFCGYTAYFTLLFIIDGHIRF